MLSEKHGILQKGVGIPVVKNFDVRDSPGKTLFQANEAIDSEFAYAPCLFDAVCVLYEMMLGVGAFEQ